MKRLVVAVVAGLAVGAGSARADSYWDHNGSLMKLSAAGNQRTFEYVVPSSRMQSTGVGPGTVLFDGQRQGMKYFGTARVFSKWCQAPLEYPVAGSVVSETHVVMTGTREVYGEGCRPTGRRVTDTLEFIYKANTMTGDLLRQYGD